MEQNLIYGRHSVKAALETNQGQKLFLQEDLASKIIDQMKKLARQKQLPCSMVPKHKLDKLTNQANHQGVVLMTSPYQYMDFGALRKKLQTKDDAVVLILDHLEDPHNLGSILRTADATGVDGIIIPKDRAVGITPVVAKTSTGALEYLDIVRVTNLAQALKQLKEDGFWLFGTDMTGTNMKHWNSSGKVGLIVGNEGKGLSQMSRKLVDEMVTIPMSGHVQSLNVSVATGILLYQIYQQRH